MELKEYTPDIVEKINRLSIILSAIGDAKLLQEHLCLYGGTALNLLHLKVAPRLSEDLDFNYRKIGDEDWGKKRDEIDHTIKRILDTLGYPNESIKIQPRYNLNRFFVRYENENGKKDLIKIEIGYMRRIPNLIEDVNIDYQHPSFPRTVKILSPKKEELYANKFSTMLSRMKRKPNIRDVFDVVTISDLDFDRDLFLDIVMLETILMDLRYTEMKFIPLNKNDLSNLEKLLAIKPDIEVINRKSKTFFKYVLTDLENRNIKEFQSSFYKNGKVRLDLLKNPDAIHPEISNHPQLLWLRKKHKIEI